MKIQNTSNDYKPNFGTTWTINTRTKAGLITTIEEALAKELKCNEGLTELQYLYKEEPHNTQVFIGKVPNEGKLLISTELDNKFIKSLMDEGQPEADAFAQYKARKIQIDKPIENIIEKVLTSFGVHKKNIVETDEFICGLSKKGPDNLLITTKDQANLKTYQTKFYQFKNNGQFLDTYSIVE